jgi:hypothetical protein
MATVTIEEVHRKGDHIGAEVWYVQTITFDHTDLTTAGTTHTVSGTAVANCWPTGLVQRYVPTLFGDGGTVTAVGLEFGDSGDPNGLGASFNAWDGGGDGDGDGDADSDWALVAPAADAQPQTFHSTYTPAVLVTTATSNTDDLTAGQASFRFMYKTVQNGA